MVEAIYLNTGEICPLERMIDLKRKFKLRLFIDESVSFGTLGKHGKGITEHKNISVCYFRTSYVNLPMRAWSGGAIFLIVVFLKLREVQREREALMCLALS